ncbi:PREDICTED: translation initiation factor eIF-2B subunit gamma [Nicrophorus vespilloides]|uniref:Translation initiation factor eIF2B subunit gamma n=1 Tax=Nicrophorus vespilloides TaxID=110193 RepID=A0ABM1MAD9_NICVS|nr:PREDICTED: translation initiation factor eIF-2B subunit gamma [Nicrophorus vespilloides]
MTVPQEFQAVILAAGKGSRMPELTAEKPKCILPIGGKPLVWYPLFKLQQLGFTETIMIVCESQKQDIQAALDKTNLTIKIDYVSITNSDEMGTADSIRLLKDRIKSDLVIASCDLITNADLSKVLSLYRKNNASICSLMFNPGKCETVVVPGPKSKYKPERDLIGVDSQTSRLVFLASASDFEQDVSLPRLLFKKHTDMTMYSNLIDSHFYVMRNWVYKYLLQENTKSTLKGEFLPHIIKKQLLKPVTHADTNMSIVNTKDVNDIFHLINDNPLNASIRKANSFNDHHGDSKEMYHGDLIRCYAHIADSDTFGVRVNTLQSFWGTNAKIMDNWQKITGIEKLTMVDEKAEVKSNQIDKTFVWDSSVLSEKTSFKNSIIGSNTKVNSFSRVFNSIVMNNVVISEKVALENCIVCNGAVIETQCTLKGCIIGSNHTVNQGEERTNEVLTDSDRFMEL